MLATICVHLCAHYGVSQNQKKSNTTSLSDVNVDKFWIKKFGSKKFWVQKNFWVDIIFGSKQCRSNKNLGLKKVWVQKIFGQKKTWVKNYWGIEISSKTMFPPPDTFKSFKWQSHIAN